MFKDLLEYFNNRRLPFFWDKDYNMLAKLNIDQMNAIIGNLNSIYRMLQQAKTDKNWTVLQTLLCKYNCIVEWCLK